MDPSQLLSLNVANQALYNTIKYQVVTGPPGPAGYTGPAGSATNTGATGTPGVSGYATNTGATGIPGQTGPAGIAGTAASTGATGQAGYSTNTGATGITGNSGITGPTGPKGEATNTGSTGSSGTPGITGATGSNGQATNTGATGAQGATGAPGSSGGSSFGVIKVPSSTSDFNFSTGVSTLPSSFGIYNPGTATDASKFTITLNGKYSRSNLPFYIVTAYAYSSTAGYINCQRQLGAQSGVTSARITINDSVTTITFNYINKTSFPSTSNDSSGYALYICFNILN